MSSVYVVSYHPLCITAQGRRAIDRFRFQPFIDASCRREPDFEAKWPTISALCRGRNFAPRLKKGDRVIYVTFVQRGVWRLVAMLEVVEQFTTHQQAAGWFRAQGLPLPNNCMVPGNPAHPKQETAFPYGCGGVRDADKLYRQRADSYGAMLACKKHYLNLSDPPEVTLADWMEWNNGKRPATRNPTDPPHLWEPLRWRATSRSSPA